MSFGKATFIFLFVSFSLGAKVKYRTSFGDCPARSSGNLAIKLIKTFEKNKSLRDLKNKMINEKLKNRFYLSHYEVKYNPLENNLNLRFNCPKPLMKVQIFKKGSEDAYEAILVDGGELYDPTYVTLLKNEGKVKADLPYLAIPLGELEQKAQREIAELVSLLNEDIRENISEIILNEENNLTIIFSLLGNPSTFFLGKSEWMDKKPKLEKIVNYMLKRKKIPTIVNLSNSKKIIVKFQDKF